MQTVRESVVGSLVRAVTHSRVFGYEEDQPGFVWPRPSDADKTAVNSPEVSRPASVKQVRSSSQSTTGTLVEPDHAPHKAPVALSDDALRREEDFEGLYRPGDERHVEHDKTSPDEVSWYGSDDPLNPKTYSTVKKMSLLALLGLYTTSVYIASAIYTPGLLLLEEEFGATMTEATLGLTLFVLGYGISPMVLTPITMQPSIGRRNIYICSFFVYIGLLAGSAGVRNLPGFLVFRFLSGLAGSPAISTVGVSIADMFDGVAIPRAIAVWGSSASLGPILGPLIGAAALVRYNTWRAPLWILVGVSSFTFVVMVFFLPETSATKILDDRKRRVAKRTNRPVQTEWEKSGMNISVLGTIRDAVKISVDPTVAYIDFQIALAYMILYSWFESFPVVYGEGGYGFTPVVQGLVYLFIGGGVVITVAFYLLWLRVSLEPKAKRNNGMLKPSDFLPPGFVGVVCMPICLLGFAWTANRTHWIVPSLFSVLFGPGIFLAFMSSLNYLGAGYYQHLVSIYALNAFFRSVFAAFGPLYSNPALRGIGVDWYSTILAICSLAMIPLPVLLHYKGDAIRARSKWAAKPPQQDAADEKVPAEKATVA